MAQMDPTARATLGSWTRAALFQGLSTADLERIAAAMVLHQFAAGEVLIQQGVWQGSLFIVHTGVVQISVDAPEGSFDNESKQTVALRRLVAGDCFGEMSLITGQPPSATVQALTAGTAWTLDQDTFLQLVTAQPELSRNINAILSERLLHTNQQQVAAQSAQVLVLVGGTPALWQAVGQQAAYLSGRAILLIDWLSAADSAVPTLTDLVAGRLRPPERQGNQHVGVLQTVQGPADLLATDLLAVLGRLAADYQLLLVTLPYGHDHLTAELLTYAAQTLVVGEATAPWALRQLLAELPHGEQPGASLGVVLTAAPQRLQRTPATLDLLGAELGAPVRAILPDEGVPRYQQELAAFCRWLVGQRIGLVFGAGGPKGFAQLGALRALRRVGLPIDVVAGTSVGAIVGGGVAMGLTIEQLEASVESLLVTLFRPTLPVRSLLSNRSLTRWARSEQAYGERLIEDLPLPYAVSAADLTSGGEIVIRRGRLWQAVLASAAIPGIYPPVMIGRHWLVDGGVVNPVPVSIARLLGADLVVALDLSEPLAAREELTLHDAPRERAPWLPDTLMRSRDIMMSEIRSHTAGEPAVVINPRVSGVSLRNVRDAAPYRAAGEAATEAVLPRLHQLLPWLADQQPLP